MRAVNDFFFFFTFSKVEIDSATKRLKTVPIRGRPSRRETVRFDDAVCGLSTRNSIQGETTIGNSNDTDYEQDEHFNIF